MHIVFRFILAALATWRLALLLAREDGPGHIFARFREKTGSSSLRELFNCVKCLGVWIAIPFAFFVGGNWIELFVIWLALAAVTALIDEFTRPPFEWQEDKSDGVLRRDSDRHPH